MRPTGREELKGRKVVEEMFELHPERCTECQICMQICAWEHYQEHNPKRSRIWIRGEWPKEPEILVCQACPTRDCIQVCPNEALTWEGFVRVHPDQCDACGACEEACPVEGVCLDPRGGLPLICDTCNGRFVCVQWCPTSAVKKAGL